jgi:hypothetical protein
MIMQIKEGITKATPTNFFRVNAFLSTVVSPFLYVKPLGGRIQQKNSEADQV